MPGWFAGATTYGQNNQTEIKKENNGVIKYIKFTPQSTENSGIAVPETADDFFKDYLNITSSDEFVKESKKQRSERFIHEHYDQFYKGVKVEGGGYNFHSKDGRMYLAHGHYVKIEGLDSNPSISVLRKRQACLLNTKIYPKNQLLKLSMSC